MLVHHELQTMYLRLSNLLKEAHINLPRKLYLVSVIYHSVLPCTCIFDKLYVA